MLSVCCFHPFSSEDGILTCVKAGVWKSMSISAHFSVCVYDAECLKNSKSLFDSKEWWKRKFLKTILRIICIKDISFSLIATSSLSRLSLWNCPGKQCWRLCEAKLPRDAWVYEKVQCTSHPWRSGVSEVSVNLLGPESSHRKRSFSH